MIYHESNMIYHCFMLEHLIRMRPFDSYSATYSPISMNLFMLPDHVRIHMVLTFPLVFIGF